MESFVSFNQLPIWHGILEKYKAPVLAPFAVSVGECGIIKQDFKNIKHFTAYESSDYSWITPPPGSSNWANHLGDMYFEFVANKLQVHLSNKGISTIRILEIGAGSTHIAEKICSKFNVQEYTIVDPGIRDTAKNTKIKIVKSYFDKNIKLEGAFDFCISLNALEHVLDPKDFLDTLHLYLTEKGSGAFVFPNVFHQFARGDLNAILHEHISYFTENSIRASFEASKLKILELSNKEDTAYVWFENTHMKTSSHFSAAVEKDFLKEVASKFDSNLNYFKSEVVPLIDNGKKVVFYGATNGLNNLLVMSGLHLKNCFSVVDSDEFKHGKYISGSQSPILSPSEITNEKVDVIFISALTFYEPIKKYLIEERGFEEEKIKRVTVS